MIRKALFRTILLLGAVLLALPSPVRAQAVSGSRSNVQVIEPMKLDRRELDRYRLFSIADALRYNSGLLFKDYGGLAGLKTINVRSLGSDRIGVFFNGVELGNAMNGQIDLSRFGMSNLNSLELYTGGRGDIYQTATDFATSNSLYINSRVPRFRGQKKKSFLATVRGGSFFTVNPSLTYEQTLVGSLSTSMNFDLYSSRGNYTYDYKRFNQNGEEIISIHDKRRNGSILQIRADGGLHGNFGNGVWNLYAYAFSSERGLPGAHINEIKYRGERLTERNFFVQGDINFFVTDSYKTRINYKVSEDFVRYENNDDKIVQVDESFTEFSAYLSNSHLVLLGEDDMFRLNGAYDLLFNHMSKRDELLDGDAIGFSNPWRLKHLGSFAASFTGWGLMVQANVYGTFVQNMGDEALNPYGNESSISPTLLLSYRPAKRVPFFIQAYGKQSYSVPNYNDRYISLVEGGILHPEKVRHLNAGLMFDYKSDGRLRNLYLSAEGFYKDIENKIVAYPTGQLFRWTMANLGKVRSLGGNVASTVLFRFVEDMKSPLFKTKFQYTYELAQDITDESKSYFEHQIPFIPVHSGSAIFSLIWRGWGLNYSFLYVGERYSRKENIAYYRMQPWYNHDVSLEKKFRFNDWSMRLMLEVSNVLGQDFEIITNYPMPKQMFRLTFNVEI